MFLVHDSFENRQEMIRSTEPFVAVLLAAADFEWTLRRSILALGCKPTKEIRESVLDKCSGLESYKQAWKKEVQPHVGKSLVEVIPQWQFFKEQAYPLRNRLVHGIRGNVTQEYASERVEALLTASRSLVEITESHGASVYGRNIIRRKERQL